MNKTASRNGQAKAAIDSWDDYFLAIAKIVALKSKDTSRVGAVIVSPDNTVVSTGYNGPPRQIFDSETLFQEGGNGMDEKLRWICHAEQNAILKAVRSGISVKSCGMYVNKFPCLACLTTIVQSGIEYVYTHDVDFWGNDPLDPKDDPGGSHWRKRALINQAKLKVLAPFHKDYQYDCGREYLSWETIYSGFAKDEQHKDVENKEELKARSNNASSTDTDLGGSPKSKRGNGQAKGNGNVRTGP